MKYNTILMTRYCIFENCNKRPIYNSINEKKPKFCRNHKTENMIIIRGICNECKKIRVIDDIFKSCNPCARNIRKRFNQILNDVIDTIEKEDNIANKYK